MSRLVPELHDLLSREVVEALHARGIFSILDFLDTEGQLLKKITKLTFQEVLSLRKFFLGRFSGLRRNGLDYYQSVLNKGAILPTGIQNVDQLLEGGFVTGNIYELCGSPASGKTLFGITLVKNLALSTKQNVYFLDSRYNFSAAKIKTMLNEMDDNRLSEVMSKILVKRILTKYDLMNSLYDMKSSLENGSVPFRIVVIDSLPILMWESIDDITELNSFLNHLVNVMHFLAVEHHVAFIVTNLIITWTEGDFGKIAETVEKMACGKYWSSVPNTRLKITKSCRNHRYFCDFTVIQSDTLKVGLSATAQITDGGLIDVVTSNS